MDADASARCWELASLPGSSRSTPGGCRYAGTRASSPKEYMLSQQIQEKLTREIAMAVVEAISPTGVGVVVEASHMCMVMRGVQKINSKTITSSMLGEFRDDPMTRTEFLTLVKS